MYQPRTFIKIPMQKIITAAALTLLVFSCVDVSQYEVDYVEAQPTFSLPLGFGDLSIRDFLRKTDTSFVRVRPDGLLYLQYTETLRSSDIRGLFNIPNRSVNRSFIIPAGNYPASPRDVRIDSLTETIDLNLSPERLDEILLKAGRFAYQTTSSPSAALPFMVEATLADFTRNGTPIRIVLTNVASGETDLRDYLMRLSANRFNLKLVLILRSRSAPVRLNSNMSVSFRCDFQNMDFHWISGFFGDQSVTLPDEVLSIGAFGNSLLTADISFAEPKVELLVTNEYSIPARVDFIRFEARKDGQVLPVQLNPPSPVAIQSPATRGGVATTPVSVANAAQLLDFAPTSLFYRVNARINPGITTGTNFLADTSQLAVRLHVEVPLFGTASNIRLLDTLDIDLSDLDASTFDSTYFQVNAANELPVDLALQFYFADQTGRVSDSLFVSPAGFINASRVTAAGDLREAGITSRRIALSTARVTQLLNARKIIILGQLSTVRDAGGQPDVKFRAQYRLRLNIGLQARLKLKARM
jgi:hypothetical protein